MTDCRLLSIRVLVFRKLNMNLNWKKQSEKSYSSKRWITRITMTKLHHILAIVLRKLLHRLKESHLSMTMNNDKDSRTTTIIWKRISIRFIFDYLILYISFAILGSIKFFQNLYMSNRCTLVYHRKENESKDRWRRKRDENSTILGKINWKSTKINN